MSCTHLQEAEGTSHRVGLCVRTSEYDQSFAFTMREQTGRGRESPFFGMAKRHRPLRLSFKKSSMVAVSARCLPWKLRKRETTPLVWVRDRLDVPREARSTLLARFVRQTLAQLPMLVSTRST